SKNRVMPRHKMVGRGKALRDMPALTPAIVATGTYYDAKISHPERLVLELVLDGLEANTASAALNYTELVSSSDGVLTFQPETGRTLSVRPKLVVNAAGPWIDRVNAMLGVRTKMIGGTKGSHILLKHDELVKSLAGRMIYFEADDGRICLVYEYLGLALVGSTDIKAANPDEVHCEPTEVAYLLDSLRALLPGMAFDRSQIVYAYSGIRPLPASDAATPGLISRDHSAPVLEADASRPFAIISLVGGKWTTFRGFAEEVADTVLVRLSRHRRVSTRSMPIGGGKDFPADTAARKKWLSGVQSKSNVEESRLDRLLSRYGTRAKLIATQDGGSGSEPLPDSQAYDEAEIDFIARNEFVEHLADIVMRRSTLAITGSLTMRDLQAIAAIAGRALGWSAQRIADEIGAVAGQLETTNLMRLGLRFAVGPAGRPHGGN
ncbi:MAG: FAD-dependent oxidoreductase, partial [Mesorhizobium sp.]